MSRIVGIEQHKKLRELGFPMVESYKDENTGQDITYAFPMPYNESEMRLPKLRGDITVHEALDWIREEKGIASGVGLNVNSDNRFLDNYIYEYVNNSNRVEGCSGFDTHSLASSALLDAVLTYLEERADV